MPDEIRINEDNVIIEIQTFGVVTKKDIAESINNTRQILEEKGISKILVDTTGQETMPDTFEIFDLFSTFPMEFRLAILIQQSQATAEDIVFAETIGVNRGVQVKIFLEKEHALEWLDNG